jgi:hypothetical protein
MGVSNFTLGGSKGNVSLQGYNVRARVRLCHGVKCLTDFVTRWTCLGIPSQAARCSTHSSLLGPTYGNCIDRKNSPPSYGVPS